VKFVSLDLSALLSFTIVVLFS